MLSPSHYATRQAFAHAAITELVDYAVVVGALTATAAERIKAKRENDNAKLHNSISTEPNTGNQQRLLPQPEHATVFP